MTAVSWKLIVFCGIQQAGRSPTVTASTSYLTPADLIGQCQMAGPWERAMFDLAAAAASPAIRHSQAPPAAGVDTSAVTRDCCSCRGWVPDCDCEL